MKKIAVLLTVFNRKEKTLVCLENLFLQVLNKDYKLEVFLTNDGCTDGTAEAISTKYPYVHIINAEGNLYWNRGMHAAWKAAKSFYDFDYYLWLNDDTFINMNAVSTLLNTSELLKNKCIVVGAVCALGNKNLISYGGWKLRNNLLSSKDEIQECDFFNGNIVMIPNYVYNIVGTNDPVFKHALGDFDYGLRAKKLEVKSVVAPGILGECDLHNDFPVWCNPNESFIKRWQYFRRPLGHNPEEFFIYEKRHNGLFMACYYYFTNHLRVLIPQLWKNKY